MHGLKPLQNRQFGSKIKTLKYMRKTSLEPKQNKIVLCKNALKTGLILKK